MQQEVNAVLTDLKTCCIRRELQRGRKIHANVVESGNDENIYVTTALINMYARCGSMVGARDVFDSIRKPDVVSWNVLLSGYAANGDGFVTLEMFSRMKMQGYEPNSVTYVAALKACASLAMNGDSRGKGECLKRGREIHLQIGNHLNHYVQNKLIDMYAKCGSMVDACVVFDSIEKPDVVSWTAMLLGYAENGDGLVALEMFSTMKARGCHPDSVTYTAALKACTYMAVSGKEGCLEQGREIQLEIGCHFDVSVHSALIEMYAKYGSMAEARGVFDSVRKPDVVSWNALLLGYVENRDGVVALEMFSRMRASECAPDSITYVAAIKACIYLGRKEDCLKCGRKLHQEIVGHLDISLQSTLIDMYAKCGSMIESRAVFDSMLKPGIVAWNALLLGYAENGEGLVTLEMFSRMKTCGCTPSPRTYIAVLKACTSLALSRPDSEKKTILKWGRQIHSQIDCPLDFYVQSVLINMYAKCHSMVEARAVFDSIRNPDVVSWTAMLLGYAENGNGVIALEMFSIMKACGCMPDIVAYVAALKACTSLAVNGDRTGYCLEWGKKIHSQFGSHSNYFVQNTLIDLYCKCGSMVDAHVVFDSMQKPDVGSWNALLLGYVGNGNGLVALEMFSRMKACGCIPDSVTYVAALKACGSTGALTLGRKFHQEITEIDAYLVTCLVDFYAKCGSMVEARGVFDLHPEIRDVTTWNALLAGYGSFGDNDSVFNLFEEMKDEGFRPNGITFVYVLLCCSHAGLLEKAKEYFEAMFTRYRIVPTVIHYTCMVDVLGRANRLNEAILLIRKMPCNPDSVIWTTLLGACRKLKNVKMAKLAFQCIDKKDASVYVLMAHIYGSMGMWEEQDKILETVGAYVKL